MVSKLSELVSGIAAENEIKIENFQMQKIKLIEKHLDASEDIETAMQELDGVLGFRWDDYYSQIKKQIERK